MFVATTNFNTGIAQKRYRGSCTKAAYESVGAAELIKDVEASVRKIGKEEHDAIRGTSVERFYTKRGKGTDGRQERGEGRGNSIKTNTLLYQELEVLANYVVYRI